MNRRAFLASSLSATVGAAMPRVRIELVTCPNCGKEVKAVGSNGKYAFLRVRQHRRLDTNKRCIASGEQWAAEALRARRAVPIP